jgi:GntR family transcriptional regulator
LIIACNGGSLKVTMIDIQPDSPVPVHEQITSQVIAHVASGALKAGARLGEYRALAQELLTNPQVVARAYADLEWEGVLARGPGGVMEVTSDAAVICRVRQQHTARQHIRRAVRDGLTSGLGEAEIRKAVEQELAAPPADVPQAGKNPTHESGYRDPQGIQVLPPQEGAGLAQPHRSGGGDIRPARG